MNYCKFIFLGVQATTAIYASEPEGTKERIRDSGYGIEVTFLECRNLKFPFPTGIRSKGSNFDVTTPSMTLKGTIRL